MLPAWCPPRACTAASKARLMACARAIVASLNASSPISQGCMRRRGLSDSRCCVKNCAPSPTRWRHNFRRKWLAAEAPWRTSLRQAALRRGPAERRRRARACARREKSEASWRRAASPSGSSFERKHTIARTIAPWTLLAASLYHPCPLSPWRRRPRPPLSPRLCWCATTR